MGLNNTTRRFQMKSTLNSDLSYVLMIRLDDLPTTVVDRA